MWPSSSELARLSVETGFDAEPLERVLQLLGVLDELARHPFLGERVALKGGTALNLFFFELPRLSVDIDLNYIGAADRETMLAERPRLEQALASVCSRRRLELRRAPSEHAGGKWRMGFTRASGAPGVLEIDLNFLLRVPLWPIQRRDSVAIGAWVARQVPVLDLHELAGGKLVALLARDASRDLFDAHALLKRGDLDQERLRLAFIVTGAANRKDWRAVRIDDLRVDPGDVAARLSPLLMAERAPPRAEAGAWAEALLAEVKSGLEALLPLRPREIEFLARLNDHGEIAPDLLTADPEMQERLRRHPGLLWKAVNVRDYKARGGAST